MDQMIINQAGNEITVDVQSGFDAGIPSLRGTSDANTFTAQINLGGVSWQKTGASITETSISGTDTIRWPGGSETQNYTADLITRDTTPFPRSRSKDKGEGVLPEALGR
jgi:hypothetical protein